MNEDLPIVVRMAVLAGFAITTALWPGLPTYVALLLALTALPITVLAPRRWREEISENDYVAAFPPFLSAIGLSLLAAFVHTRDEHSTEWLAVFLAAAAVLLVLSARVAGYRPDWRRTSVAVSAAVWGIAGVLVELPTPPAAEWLGFAAYGASGAAVCAALRRPPANKRGCRRGAPGT